MTSGVWCLPLKAPAKFFMFNYVVNMLIPFYELCGHSTDTSSGSCSPLPVAPCRGLVLWLQLAPIQEGLSLSLW